MHSCYPQMNIQLLRNPPKPWPKRLVVIYCTPSISNSCQRHTHWQASNGVRTAQFWNSTWLKWTMKMFQFLSLACQKRNTKMNSLRNLQTIWYVYVCTCYLYYSLQEVLRNVPGCVLMSSRYTEFVATNDIKDIPTRVLHVQRYVMPWRSTHQFTTHLDLAFTTNISHKNLYQLDYAVLLKSVCLGNQ